MIRVSGTDEYKIGCSGEPKARRANLQKKIGKPLEIILSVYHPDPFRIERQAQKMVLEYLVAREWFRLPADVAENITDWIRNQGWVDPKKAGEIQPILLRASAVAKLMGKSEHTIWRMRKMGLIPMPIRVGKRLVRWRAKEIMDWLAAHQPAQPALLLKKQLKALPNADTTPLSAQ